MTNGFIEGGGWPDPAEKEAPEHSFEISLRSLFLLGLLPSILSLIVLGLEFFRWLTAHPGQPLLSIWSVLAMGILVCEMGLIIVLVVRCQEKGITLGEVFKRSLGHGLPRGAREKPLRRSYKETIEEMRKLYGWRS